MTLTESSRALLGVSTAFTVLAVVTVLLRVNSRRTVQMMWGWDDGWVIAATLSLVTLYGTTIWSAVVGGAEDLNKQPEEIQVKSFETFLKAQFIGDVFYLFAISAARYSLTCLYRRIFPIRSVRYATIAIDFFNSVYMISTIFGNIFSCHPVDFLWHPVEGGYCFAKFNLFVVITESFGVFMDFAILLLPLRSVMILHMPVRARLLICGIFCLGGFVVITGIVRVILSYNSTGKYVNFMNSSLWTSIHCCTGVICVNLPTFKPLFPKFVRFSSSVRRRYNNLRSATTRAMATPQASSKNIDGDSTYFTRIRASGSQEGMSSTASGTKDVQHDTYELDKLERNQIRVNRTVDQEVV